MHIIGREIQVKTKLKGMKNSIFLGHGLVFCEFFNDFTYVGLKRDWSVDLFLNKGLLLQISISYKRSCVQRNC